MSVHAGYQLRCPSCGVVLTGDVMRDSAVWLLELLTEAGYTWRDRGYIELYPCPSCLAAATEGDTAPAPDGAAWQDSLLDALAL